VRTFGIIGYPLGHSFSPGYFKNKFEREGITDASYSAFPLENIHDFPQLLAQYGPTLRGLNVTIPYKETIIPFLDEITDTAREVGAVNCIAFENGKTIGHNTDAPAFEQSIKPFLENKYERALVIGTGGASKAVSFVLRKWNMQLFHLTRNPQAANHLAYGTLTPESMKHFKLIINTTPLGMWPNEESKPNIPYEGLGSEHFLYDLVYNPELTAFMAEGKAHGSHVMNGLHMLVLQAEKGWDIWNRSK
jgi:shikimate dehydrogenase